MTVNYYLGKLLDYFGYKVTPAYKYPACTLNLVELGYELIRYLPKEHLNIIQIGAFDGSLVDPLRIVLERASSKILLVEPQVEPFNALQVAYNNAKNVILENIAIHQEDGYTELYVPSLSNSSPKASLSSQHHKRFGTKNRDIKTVKVPTLSVKTLLEKHDFRSVALLQVDTEGFDYKVVKQFFNLKIYPLIINCETFHLNSDERSAIRQDFTQYGYSYVDTQYDTFAIRWRELMNSSELFSRVVNTSR